MNGPRRNKADGSTRNGAVAPHANAPEEWAAWCLARLGDYEKDPDPLSNPVRRLAYDLAEREAAGAIDQSSLEAIAKVFADQALMARADSFRERHSRAPDLPRVAALYERPGAEFAKTKALIERPRAGIVFTAHPTFALSRAATDAFAARVSDGAQRTSPERQASGVPPTLRDEHRDAQAALAGAQEAIGAIIRATLQWAQRRYPDDWTRLCPAPLTLATWVGYDLDGRTDISWAETFRIRLEEKETQLRRYAARLANVATRAAERERLVRLLKDAAELAAEQCALFAGDLGDPKAVTRAANALTGADPRRLTSLSVVIADLGRLIDGAGDEARIELAVLRAEINLYGLGVARLHLRVNAAQVASALRAELGLDTERELLDRSVLDTAARRAGDADLRKVNFASIFHEKMTARRQFMLCAEFLKHVDSDTPIRFLIAECEAPATVMGAVYLARLYGVADKVDISPLFETPEAIERGGRFIERLLAEPEFVAYIRVRGRIAIQAGFSDSGRFMGQAAAGLAIERLQILFARALGQAGIRDVEALVFNTHGESMGRGGFPGSLEDRFDYLMTPWARARFAREGIGLAAETSFQGGDGFLHFATPALAAATTAALFAWGLAAPAADMSDRYYRDINYSWDVYRAVKAWQERLFADPDNVAAVSAFGPQLLVQSGSRKLRRQSDAAAGLRSMRAIPHNAVLQQLAAPINVFGGWSAAGAETDRLIDHVRGSPRIGRILDLAAHARARASVPVVRAYALLFSPSFWISKAGSASGALADRCAQLARELSAVETADSLSRFADLMAADLLKFDAVMRALGDRHTDEPGASPLPHVGEKNPALLALHALRQAMIMKGFLLAASLPAFSRRHDLSRSDLLALAFELRFDELADFIDSIFPASEEDPAAFAGIEEAGDSADIRGYPEIRAAISAPLRAVAAAIREIGVGVSHFYDAYG